MTDQTQIPANRPEDQLIPITPAQAIAACQALGLEPSEVAEIRISPDWVFVTYRDGERKHPIPHDHAGQPWTDTGSGPGYTEGQIP